MTTKDIRKARVGISIGDKVLLHCGFEYSAGHYVELKEPEVGIVIDTFEHHFLIKRSHYIESFSYIDLMLGQVISLI